MGYAITNSRSWRAVHSANDLQNGETFSEVIPQLSEAEILEDKLTEVRSKRQALLSACDWTQLPDAVLSIEEKAAWQEYRQALRDVLQTFVFPDDVVWPVAPGAQ